MLPRDAIVGDAACLRNGELRANALDQADIKNGFNAACFVPETPNDDLWMIASSWSSCALQFFYARVISWLYDGNTTAIGIAFRLLLGNAPTITYHRGTILLPDVVTVVWPTAAVAVVDGTSNFQQLATQAFLSIIPPTNIGLYGTLALWYSASSWVHQCLQTDGANPTGSVMLVGHSYGGATVANLAARYRAANRDRAIRYLTFGCPKPGDQRLQSYLSFCPGLALADDDDPVPAIPPNNLALYPVMVALGVFRLAVWTEWLRIPNQALQAFDGSLTFNQEATLGFATLLNFAQRALAGQLLPAFPGHPVDEYAARIITRCPFAEWPVSDTLMSFLEGRPVARGGAAGGGAAAAAGPPIARGGGAGGGAIPSDAPIGRGGASGSGASSAPVVPVARGGAAGGGSIPSDAPVARGGGAGSGITAPPPAGGWLDHFTDTTGVTLPPHLPNIGTGGYTVCPSPFGGTLGSLKISSNTVIAASLGFGFSAGEALVYGDPALAAYTMIVKINLDSGFGDGFQAIVRYDPLGGNSNGLFLVIELHQLQWAILTAGSLGSVIDPQNPALTTGVTYTVTITVTATSVSASVNGVTSTATTGSFAGNTKIAFGITASMGVDATFIDDLSVS